MNSLLPTRQHGYQTVEALSWYYCNNYLHWCFEYTCMHWGYPCIYSQCLQLSLQTADFSSPVSKITLLSLELDGFSSHFCLQPSLVLLTMPRSNMHVLSHLDYPIHRFPTLSVCISLHCLLISASLSWITSVCCWICSVCCWICSVCCWIWASFCWSWVFLCWSWPFLCSSLPLLS